jgi:hypothetical protein
MFDDRTVGDRDITRRRTLQVVGATAFLGAVTHGGAATSDRRVYRVVQGDTSFEVTPLSGDEPVETLYDLRIPSRYTGDNGATDPGSGPYFRSVGTTHLQRESTTICFLYDGPNGLSFVVVHDKPGGDGGAVSWKLESVPNSADWLVKDDLYLEPDTGEQAASNYDNWDTSGTTHEIDWTWAKGGTDGGALGYLDGAFAITIHPAYNGDSSLYGDYYEGDVTGWQVLSATSDGVERKSLSLKQSVKLVCERSGGGGEGDDDDGGDGDDDGDDDHEGEEEDDRDDEEDDRDDEEDDRDDRDDEEDEKDDEEDEEDEKDEEDEDREGEDEERETDGDQEWTKADIEAEKREWQRMKRNGDPDWREEKRDWKEKKREWQRQRRGSDD